MARKLASIQIIDSLTPIPNADRIEKAQVMGWGVVVKKGEFEVGSKCVFFEVDSVLPDGPDWSEFMRPRNFRVKTCKLRGELSQGLALPITILPETYRVEDVKYCDSCGDEVSVDWKTINPREFEVGTDVTDVLKVDKYIPKPRFGFRAGAALGPFPAMIPKTDETRLQSILPVLEEIKGIPIYWTVKCDGTSGTFAKLNGEFMACSRNLKKKPGDNVYWQIAEKYKLEEFLPEGFAVQGEVCGPGVQKNRLGLEEIDLFVFDVFDIKAGRYMGLDKFRDFCGSHLKTVPIEQVVSDPSTIDLSLDAWLERAKGLYEGTNNRREGIVVRAVHPTFSRATSGRLSFKVLNNEFLLKDED